MRGHLHSNAVQMSGLLLRNACKRASVLVNFASRLIIELLARV
jgi:hypothetical protein